MAVEQKVARLATESTTQATAQAANTARETLQAGASQATKASEGILRSAEDAMEFGRGNMEAITQAAQTYFAGAQDLGRQTLALMQQLQEEAMQNARSLATMRSIKDVSEMQTSFGRQTMEKLLSETTRLQEASFRLAEQSTAPIAQRMTQAMERMSRTGA